MSNPSRKLRRKKAKAAKTFKPDIVQYNEADAKALGEFLHRLKIPALTPELSKPLVDMAQALHDVVKDNDKMSFGQRAVLACFQRRILDIGNVTRHQIAAMANEQAESITKDGGDSDPVSGEASQSE